MKTFFILALSFLSVTSYADDQYIRCTLRSNYEIYRGEGLVERGEGSLIAVPVDFYFFTNNQAEYIAGFTGGRTIVKVKAIATDSEATIFLSGGPSASGAGFSKLVTFTPQKGTEQYIERDQLTPFNYAYGPNRVVFSRAVFRCSPSVLWDMRPVTP